MSNKAKKKEPDARVPIMVLSGFCAIALYALGLLSREMDTGYILVAIIIFILCLIEPIVVRAWKYYQAKAREEKLREEKLAKEKILAEKRRKQQEAEEARLAEERRRELVSASASADDQLKARAQARSRN